jgi:hypothetical protein
MKMAVATLAIVLLLVAFSSIVTAQGMEQETEEQPMQTPMMQGMMGGGMMGQTPMMQQGATGGQGWMMPMMQSGMICPMCGQVIGSGIMGQTPMMQGTMGGQGWTMPMMQGMMGQMPMMQGTMGGQGWMMPMMQGTMGGQGWSMPMMQGMMGRGMMGWMYRMFTPQMLLFWTKELDLKEEQVKSIENIWVDLQKEAIQKNADRSIAEVELNALLSEDELNLEQAQQKIQQIATLEGDLRIAQIKAFYNMKEVLTDEQRAKLKEFMIKRATMYTTRKSATQEEKKAETKSMH